MYYVYILYSKIKGKFYIGFTSNLKRRLKGHYSGKSRYTRQVKDWIIVYYEKYKSKTEALKRENAIKKKKSKKYIIGLIKDRQA